VHLIGVYLTGVYLMGVHLIGVYFMGVHLMGVYLMGVHLIDVYFMDVYSRSLLLFLDLAGVMPMKSCEFVPNIIEICLCAGVTGQVCFCSTAERWWPGDEEQTL
jgi:hypothetical protein